MLEIRYISPKNDLVESVVSNSLRLIDDTTNRLLLFTLRAEDERPNLHSFTLLLMRPDFSRARAPRNSRCTRVSEGTASTVYYI